MQLSSCGQRELLQGREVGLKSYVNAECSAFLPALVRSGLRVVLISDTHSKHRELVGLPNLPGGDLIIHAGDSTKWGTKEELARFLDWYSQLDYKTKILIAGNHDWCFTGGAKSDISQAVAQRLCDNAGVIYLCDSGTMVKDFLVWGTPWQPEFRGYAFNIKEEQERADLFAQIPDNTDLLVTHAPPAGILDLNRKNIECGCRALAKRVADVRPLVHVFGHIHESYGATVQGETLFVNASIYRSTQLMDLNDPLLLEISDPSDTLD